MSDLLFYDVLRQGLWIAVLTSAPILAVALAVGLAIGLLQALTSIQEMTLTFVPKMAAILGVFWACMGFMTLTLGRYFTDTLIPIIQGY
ncbi:flagellar biosynthetic protein FliQ [Jannaschia sp. S6380]|uniref:flagellar biosynthetic protein FliQ n=1 Tax=Jannaschia sp. S6380 TaxID=2926408 RepID=UPI001FF10789|nr:flagellar biosynthetic protein FliQ [Jannaschia sp. S6380]MCK0168262.1 flagellar biosynthetic protein FliQ [Jannaschia sp. S6380]